MTSFATVATTLLLASAGAGAWTVASLLTEDESDGDLVPVELATVGVDGSGTPIVLLRHPESGDIVPIWVGLPEAQAIARALHGVEVPRPMTHDLMASLLSEMNAEVDEVVVHELRGQTYFGAVRLRVPGETEPRTVDSRPSDALALALRTGAPIRVARSILIEPPDFEFIAPEAPEQVVQALGVTVVAATPALREEFALPERAGVVVTHAAGHAHAEGLRRGDLIAEVNGRAVEEPLDFFQAIRAAPPGSSVTVVFWRQGDRREIELPADLPPERPRDRRRVVV